MSLLMRRAFLSLAENKTMYRFIVGNEVTRRMTRRFVAGEELAEALASMKTLNEAHIMGSLDLLGENVYTESEAREAGALYEGMLDAIASSGVNTNVSLKLTQMGLDVDPALCREVVAGVVGKAREHGNFVRIDMEGSAYTQVTMDLFKDLFAEFGPKHVGIVLQAYLFRTEADVEEMIRLGARVRLCKGAYAEPPEVAYPEKKDVDAAYLRLMERLMTAGNYPGLATHDEAIIRHAQAFAEREKLAPERYEFQMLYGIRSDLQHALAKQGYNVRCYVPFGTQWYPYFMRRLAERPANVWFLVNNAMK